MTKTSSALSALIVGLVFYRFFPQYALFLCIASAIVLAIYIEERHGFLKKLQKSKRKAKKKTSTRTRGRAKSA